MMEALGMNNGVEVGIMAGLDRLEDEVDDGLDNEDEPAEGAALVVVKAAVLDGICRSKNSRRPQAIGFWVANSLAEMVEMDETIVKIENKY